MGPALDYECAGCGAVESYANRGLRILRACQTCGDVTAWERVPTDQERGVA